MPVRSGILLLVTSFHILPLMAMQNNVFGETLRLCSTNPMTGWHRDGYLNTDPRDYGLHTVCAAMTSKFLAFTKSKGNDLSTPHPPSFPGLKPGDRWGLCAARWYEAHQAGMAPYVDLEATNEAALKVIPLDVLLKYDVKKADKSEL